MLSPTSSAFLLVGIVAAAILSRLLYHEKSEGGAYLQAVIGFVAAIFWAISLIYLMLGATSQFVVLAGLVGLVLFLYLAQTNYDTIQQQGGFRARLFG